ncbi:MAG TPA: serine hydroxymethyltransferase [Candidatus Bathyarchaeia archaeon]|nr:serine hydroxymethyltransferase [Candidatus Bathyarchaeia archaeon]
MIDKEVFDLIRKEEKRQEEGLELIPSENYVSKEVRQALGCILTNKYSEGYPRKRYYGGNEVVDEIESLAIKRAKRLFKVPHVNVQPYSGSPANWAVHGALCQPGDIILSQHLSHGGHLSMGQEANLSSKFFHAYYYHLTADGSVDFKELESLAKKIKPKVIWSGGTAYTIKFNFLKYAQIADQVGAYFVADIAHIAGLIIGGIHPSPVRYAHLVTTTTHKTLRGPRGGMIMVTKKGLKTDPDLARKIDRAVFPGLQGGPHDNQIAALAIALKEASTVKFKEYTRQVVVNARALARILKRADLKLIGNGTENHMIWVDLTDQGIDGWQVQVALDVLGISINRQTIPFDLRPAYYPSGIRLGTPAVTTRGMKEAQMRLIGDWIIQVINIVREIKCVGLGSSDREEDQAARKEFKEKIKLHPHLRHLQKEVKSFCLNFPIP